MGGGRGYQKIRNVHSGAWQLRNESRGGRGKINTNEGSGHWHICDLHVYMRCIRSYSQKTPSPHLFHAPSVNMVIADVHRDAADAGDAPRTSSAGAVVAVEDELDASVCQAGDQRECDEPEHHKEGIRPSRLVGGGGRLRRRLAVDAFI